MANIAIVSTGLCPAEISRPQSGSTFAPLSVVTEELLLVVFVPVIGVLVEGAGLLAGLGDGLGLGFGLGLGLGFGLGLGVLPELSGVLPGSPDVLGLGLGLGSGTGSGLGLGSGSGMVSVGFWYSTVGATVVGSP